MSDETKTQEDPAATEPIAAEVQAAPVAPPTAEPAPEQAAAPEGPATPEATTAEAPAATSDTLAAPASRGETTGAKADAAEAGAPARKAPSPRQASLYRALRSGRPLQGRIENIIKGGYEVRLGKARGFCPHSQMDLHRVDDPEQHLGQTYYFRVTQVRRGGEDVVVSRRQLLEADQKENAKALRAALVAGSVVEGRVASVADFGAFVELGAGVRGLVHVSEISHNRVDKVANVLSVGDAVRVKILKIDEAKGRISLSVRQATADPWAAVAETFEPGRTYPGKVLRVTDFGAFVELAPGVEALAPGSEFPPSQLGWQEGLEVGAACEWLVLAVDPRRRRISLTPPVVGMTDQTVEPGAQLRGRVQRVERFGVFVWMGPGKVGLMPAPFTGTPRGADLSRSFNVGEEIEVQVVDIEEGGRRIRLAKPGAYDPDAAPAPRQRRDRDDRRPSGDSMPPPSQADAGTFGTALADKLRAALGKPD